MYQILVTDGNEAHGRCLSEWLTKAGYHVDTASDTEQALLLLDQSSYDMVVVDSFFEDKSKNGPENAHGKPSLATKDQERHFLETLREFFGNLAIFVLEEQPDRERMLEAFRRGADEVMTWPLDEEELLLRAHAVLRRTCGELDEVMRVGGTVLDSASLSVRSAQGEQILPKKEFYLLMTLLSDSDRAFTREQLMDKLWGGSGDKPDATVSVHINRLRKRFRDNPDFKIITIRGLGYRARLTANR